MIDFVAKDTAFFSIPFMGDMSDFSMHEISKKNLNMKLILK